MPQTFPHNESLSAQLERQAVPGAPEQADAQSKAQADANAKLQADAQQKPREDVLTHLTKSAVVSVADSFHLGLSDKASENTATWIVRAAKSVPLFCPGGRGMQAAVTYGSAALLYGASEVKWGDSADNMTKDALLGGLKGVGIKGSMDLIGGKMQAAGLEKEAWAAPAQGIAFGVTSTATETALSRSTYYDENGNYQGLGYGLKKTAAATFNVENLAVGAATFTLGAGSMKLLQNSRVAAALPEVIGNRVFQSAATGFSFGAFSGAAGEAQKQSKDGKFSGWELNKYDYGKIASEGLFAATSDAAGAALGGRLGMPAPTVETVKRIDKPANETIKDKAHLNETVEAPLRKAVADLWDKNIQTTGSGVLQRGERRWSIFGPSAYIGEYEPPYYRMKLCEGDLRGYEPVNDAFQKVAQRAADDHGKQHAYIVMEELTLSPENARIAREIGRFREDGKVEIHVPVEPGTPAKQLEQAMLTIAQKFQPQPMSWGYKTPIQFYRESMKAEAGVPSDAWMTKTVNSPEFKQQGLVFDREHNLIFPSKEMAAKFNDSPPPEPSWYTGPETFGAKSRGGWRQAYNQAAVHFYTPEGQGLKRPTPETARMPGETFSLADLRKPENAEYYLSSHERFFELFGTKAFEAIADRHWLEMRNKAFESVEKHWPSASVEKDRALMLGTTLIARAAERYGYMDAKDLWTIEAQVPKHLWKDPDGRNLSPEEVLDKVNRVYYEMFQLRNQPFDHNFGKQLIERMDAPEGDNAYDKNQFRVNKKRSLENIVENGLEMQIHPKYAPLLREIHQKQSEGMIPERFEVSRGADGFDEYTPVYRTATQEERILPISELVKNLKIVDYGFKNRQGLVLGKVSLASHDVHDHARAFWLFDKEGLFDGKNGGPDYSVLMGKLDDPTRSNMFRREGELIASVAYDWRNYFDLHPDYQPQVDLRDTRNYLLSADRYGMPLSKNQARALEYLEERIQNDPEGQQPESKLLRHILSGVWHETLEQKRKTDNNLWQRSDGTYQRMSATNPEYLAFVIDAARILQRHSADMQQALNQNNLKMENYLRGIAGLQGDATVGKLKFTPDEVKLSAAEQPLVSAEVPAETQSWLMQHPGFNTRRAPIRNWMIGQPTEYELHEQRMAAWQAELQADHKRWIREQLFRDRFDLD